MFFWFCPGGFAMNAMIAKYLKDFSTPAPAEMAGSSILESLSSSSFTDLDFESEPIATVDIEAERKGAYDEGYQAAAASLEARHAEDLAALREAHAAELEAMAAAHEDEVIGTIHTRFHEMTQILSLQLAEQALQVLQPLFDEHICQLAVATLAATVRDTLQQAGSSAVIVRGPAHLYARLRPLFEKDGIESRLVETPSVDISVEIADTVLVTRLAAWAQSIAEVTG